MLYEVITDRLDGATGAGGMRPGTDRPLTILIGALGGEGGGVLADWIVEAATRAGMLVRNNFV